VLDLILEEGVFHRAAVFGERAPAPPGADLQGRPVVVEYAGRTLCRIERVPTDEATPAKRRATRRPSCFTSHASSRRAEKSSPRVTPSSSAR